jgi:hypothetical protein
MKKPCKECPWVVNNSHNDMIVRFSKKMDKPHNCHMVNGGKELWNLKEGTKCNGRKKYENSKTIDLE